MVAAIRLDAGQGDRRRGRPGGSVYAAGSFSGTSDFGSGSLMSAGASDIFLLALGADGRTAPHVALRYRGR